MRAGTSRGPFFLREWLPDGDEARDQALIGAMPPFEQLIHALQLLRHRSAFSSKATAYRRRDLHQSPEDEHHLARREQRDLEVLVEERT
jgi:hypothetical protein